MDVDTNRRAYKRDHSFNTAAKVSLDGNVWHDAEVFDISAGGVKFVTNIIFEVGEDLWFELEVPEFLDKREMKLKGTIRRQEEDMNDRYVYGVSFKDMNPAVRVGIDENIMLKERKRKKGKVHSSD